MMSLGRRKILWISQWHGLCAENTSYGIRSPINYLGIENMETVILLMNLQSKGQDS